MTTTDDAGAERHTTGVIGALELSPPGTDILPHEHTTKKAKSDRLDLLRSLPGEPLGHLGPLARQGPHRPPAGRRSEPLADVVDEDGVRHTVWRVDDPGTCAAISAAVAEQPVVVADGHHRYETSLAYKARAGGRRGRRRATPAPRWPTSSSWSRTSSPCTPSTGSSPGSPTDLDLVAGAVALVRGRRAAPAARPGHRRRWSTPAASPSCSPTARCCSGPGPTRWPRPATSTRAVSTSASPRSPTTSSRFQHGVDNVRAAVAAGAAQAGVLLRPATVAQIEATAHGGERMPPKTTFFHPKPKTGLVFRSLG